jgi:hypothetical protein
MNDFTKEELEHLLSSMNETRNNLGHDDELINKIKSMLDNYNLPIDNPVNNN